MTLATSLTPAEKFNGQPALKTCLRKNLANAANPFLFIAHISTCAIVNFYKWIGIRIGTFDLIQPGNIPWGQVRA
jgi:hypothetical protein